MEFLSLLFVLTSLMTMPIYDKPKFVAANYIEPSLARTYLERPSTQLTGKIPGTRIAEATAEVESSAADGETVPAVETGVAEVETRNAEAETGFGNSAETKIGAAENVLLKLLEKPPGRLAIFSEASNARNNGLENWLRDNVPNKIDSSEIKDEIKDLDRAEEQANLDLVKGLNLMAAKDEGIDRVIDQEMDQNANLCHHNNNNS